MKDFPPKTSNAPVSAHEYNTLVAELEATRKKLYFAEALVENIPLPLFFKDEQGHMLGANEAYEDFFQVKKDEVLHKKLNKLDYFSEEEQRKYHEDALHSIQNLSCQHCERVYNVAGKEISTLFWGKGFAVPQTEERGLIGTIVDITKQKKLEYALAEKVEELHNTHSDMQLAKERMQLMLDTMPLAAQIWSNDGRLLDSSLEAARLFEFAAIEDLLKNFTSSINPEYQPNGRKSLEYIQEILQQTFEKGTMRVEWLHISKTGEHIPLDITTVRSSLHGEQVALVFLKDMREHYANLEKLREADEYTRLMLDSSPLGALIWDKDFNLMYCNKALALNFGLQEAEDFVKHFLQLLPEHQPSGETSLQVMQNTLHQALRGEPSEIYWMGKSITGEEVPCQVRATRTKYRGEYIVSAYVEDLRKSEAQKKKLQLAEQRTAAILEGVPLGITLLRSDFTALACNDVAVALTGHANQADYLADFVHVLAPMQPDGRDAATLIYDVLTQTQRDGKGHCELMGMDVNKNEFPLEVTTVSAHLDQEDLYIVYARDLRETKRMLKEIEDSRTAAEKSAEAKSEFLANMSHEIRTPMNGILGLLHLLSGTELTSHQQDYLQKALFSTNELLRIINDILDFSKIEAGKLEMESLTFNLHEICSELQSLLGHSIHKKGLHFTLEEGLFPTTSIVGDPLRLKQVLLNLLGNAIKFTSQGSVSLIIESTLTSLNSTSQRELHCTFTVKDTGIGLSQEQISGLFSAFSQADSSVTRKYGGTGLGLAISKRFVEMMQGEIWVESTQGEGSSFIFTAIFPVATAQEDPLPLSATPAHAELQQHSEHLLLVEDNQINQLIAEELLKSVGYTLDIANNGQEALTMLENTLKDVQSAKKYAAVLMDIQMPVMDGLTATKIIRQNAHFAHLPIIAMSAHAMSGDKEKSLQHGMNDHITKPISPQILYSTLDYWLAEMQKEKP